jgi:hypothetical protein
MPGKVFCFKTKGHNKIFFTMVSLYLGIDGDAFNSLLCPRYRLCKQVIF